MLTNEIGHANLAQGLGAAAMSRYSMVPLA